MWNGTNALLATVTQGRHEELLLQLFLSVLFSSFQPDEMQLDVCYLPNFTKECCV
jgi:hypothetical protein